ncbi:MAG: Ldh family oxidoreductase [Pseudoflavonifractor sp.]
MIRAQDLRSFITALYENEGMPKADALFHADGLVDASLRGVDSHGVMRTGPYFDRIHSGAITLNPQIKVVSGDKAMLVLDADGASGYVAARDGMEKAIELAKTYHIGLVFVRNSNHFGPASLYAQMAVDAGMVGFSATNVKPLITAPGASGNVVGNNPFAVGIPTYNEFPFMLDMALSVVAGGKLKMAIKKGEKIPLGWATDTEGNPTDDPQKGFDGYLLPVGGFKGLGMAYAIDILCGVLTGGAFQNHIKNMFKDPEDPSQTCHMLMAIDADAMLGRAEIQERMAEYRDYIQSIPTLSATPLTFPGEIEAACKAERLEHGIPVPDAVYRELQDLAKRSGVTMNF